MPDAGRRTPPEPGHPQGIDHKLARHVWCQANGNLSQDGRYKRISGGQLTPFSQRSLAKLLEVGPAVQVTLVVEMIVNRSVG